MEALRPTRPLRQLFSATRSSLPPPVLPEQIVSRYHGARWRKRESRRMYTQGFCVKTNERRYVHYGWLIISCLDGFLKRIWYFNRENGIVDAGEMSRRKIDCADKFLVHSPGPCPRCSSSGRGHETTGMVPIATTMTGTHDRSPDGGTLSVGRMSEMTEYDKWWRIYAALSPAKERMARGAMKKMKLFLLCNVYNVTVRRLRFRDLRDSTRRRRRQRQQPFTDAAAVATPVRPRRTALNYCADRGQRFSPRK